MQKQTSEAQDVDSIAESNLDANLMLKIDKINSQAISIQSDNKRSNRRNSAAFNKTMEVNTTANQMIYVKKGSFDQNRPDDLGITQNSTFYSMN